MNKYDRLILENKAWAEEKSSKSPTFFDQLGKEQQPSFFWIGSSDSQLPEAVITNTQPGEIFVHRNIGNQVNSKDPNFMSALQYAVDVLKVEHIIICGNYACSGVKAALSEGENSSFVQQWVEGIKTNYAKNQPELDVLTTEEQQKKMVELNVIRQYEQLIQIDLVQKVLQENQQLAIHCWVFDPNTGLVSEIEFE